MGAGKEARGGGRGKSTVREVIEIAGEVRGEHRGTVGREVEEKDD